MPETSQPNINSWLEDELYQQYLHDRQTVDATWTQGFESNGSATAPVADADAMQQAAVTRLIQAWRERGHLIADLDPLGSTRPPHLDLEPSAHGLTIRDLDRSFHADGFGVTTLRALIDRLRLTYAGKMGVQYMHIDDPEERGWLEQRIESEPQQGPPEPATRRRALENVIRAEDFELFLDTRYKGHKRFSLEGAETMI